MKKSDLWTGVLMILAGVAFLLAALLLDTGLESIFCGFFGGFTAGGAGILCKYYKLHSPKHAAEYREKLEEEQIDLRDERKEMLRNRSGRYAYILGLMLMAVSIVIVSILGKMEVIGEEAAQLLTICLAIFLIVQYIAGLVIYRLLSRKY